MAWLIGWNRRKSKIINGMNQARTNAIINITVYKGSGTDTATDVYCSNIRDDFIDLRFTKSDETTLLAYKILSSIPGTSANVIIQVDSVPAAPDSTAIYIYYDNLTATDAQTPTLSTYSISYNNLNDSVPHADTPFGLTCAPRIDVNYTYTIPSTFDEAWIAIQGLTTYTDITNDTNGVLANDLYVLDVSGVQIFNIALPGTTIETCGAVTARAPKSVNITNTLSPLKGTSVTFRVRLIDSQGTGFSATSGSVYFITAPIPSTTLGAWGIEEVAAVIITVTSIIPSLTSCVEPCSLTVDITWINNGNVAGTFEPAIVVDTVRTGIGTPISLDPGLTRTQRFTITGLIVGSHTICADPNTGVACATVTVSTPANITATAITPSVTICTEPCDLTVDVTWTNTGGVSGTFTPSINIDGTPIIPAQYPSESLGAGESVTHTFTVTGLTEGPHIICPDPDTGLTCAAITVEKVVAAGFGTAGMLLIGGLAIGFLLLARRKKEEKKE